MNILFLCTGNSCRSIIAEAIFNHFAPNEIRAVSAGSDPAGFVHPEALAILSENRITHSHYYSKSIEALTVKPDVVIRVCAQASCPLYPGLVTASWPLPDPAQVHGESAVIKAAFSKTYTVLQARIEKLLALVADKKHQRVAWQQALLVLEELNANGTM